MKRILLFGLLAGVLTANTGCGLLHAVFCCRPCGDDCSPCSCNQTCDEDCGSGCGVVGRPIRTAGCVPRRAAACTDCGDGCGDCGTPCRARNCGGACNSCCDSCCDPCADPCGTGCYGRPWYRGPLSCVFALLTQGCCGAGCGERYWGDFYSDPPDCWDPCDGYGNYSGGGCRTCGGGSGNYSGGGCRTCGGSGYHRGYANGGADDGVPMGQQGQIISQTDGVVTHGSKSAGSPHRAPKPDSPTAAP